MPFRAALPETAETPERGRMTPTFNVVWAMARPSAKTKNAKTPFFMLPTSFIP